MMQARWVVAAAMGSVVVAPAGAIVPSTDEAVARGVIYLMQEYPQDQGLTGSGCGFADLDGDGDPDMILLGAATGRVGIFENDGSGYFTDRSIGNGIPLLTEASGFSAADYDGDGLVDLYLTQLGVGNYLLRNAGQFQFTNVTAAAGVNDMGAGTASCWGDYDGDTRLDLYVCNYNGAVQGTSTINNKLYRNLGNGTFADVSAAQTVNDHGYGFQAQWFDFDLDGDVDLYLSNDRGHQPPLFRTNQLWRNDNGQMVNISATSGAGLGLFSMGVACGDFDGNGLPDLYCTNIDAYEFGFNPLFLNYGDPVTPFIELSQWAGVDHWITSWGCIFYDFDNTGTMDLYVNNQFQANSLYLGLGAFPCIEAGAVAGVTANAGISYASAVGDVDGDGDLDLLVNNLGGNVELLINHEGDTRNSIQYRMVGLGDNLHGVGGKVRTKTTYWQLREIMAGGNGYLGQNELTVHVGLGAATVATEVQVRWPQDAAIRTLTNLPAGSTWTLYPPEQLGDGNGDSLVLLADYLVFAGCHAAGFQPGCEMMDFDGDSTIGLDDFDALLAVYAGPLYDCDSSGDLDLLEMLLDPGLDVDADGVPDSCEAQGDIDGNGTVSVTDLLVVLGGWGPCSPGPSCPGDVDGDGVVGVVDLLVGLANWG